MGKINENKGFTLIEIIITIAILGIIAMGFLSSLGLGFTTIGKMGQKSQAMAEAQKIIDTKDLTSLVNYEDDYDTMLTTPFDPMIDDIGRYCVTSNAFTIPKIDLTLEDKSNNMITVLIFYPDKKSFETLSYYTNLNP